MIIKFKNKHIYFSVESIWEKLDYKFKFELNALITQNSDDDFIQTLDISEEILIQIFSSLTVNPEGVSASINKEMQSLLLPQIMEKSNLEAVIEETEMTANEGARILIAINGIRLANEEILKQKIISGKYKILK